MSIKFVLTSFFLFSSLNASAESIELPLLIEKYELPQTTMRMMRYHSPSETENLSTLDQPNQISCARKQLAEWQKTLSLIKGGKDAIEKAFEKASMEASFLLIDARDVKRTSRAEVEVNLDSAPISSTDRPFNLSVMTHLGANAKGEIICNVADANEIAESLVNEKRLKLSMVPATADAVGPHSSGASAKSVK